MVALILILISLLNFLGTNLACEDNMNFLFHPILDRREYRPLINWNCSLNYYHPIAHDVERVRNLNYYKQNERLKNFDNKQTEDVDDDEFEGWHHFLVPDFIGLVNQHNENYTAEEHKVQTEDGYNLILHRISGSPEYPPSPGKPVVFIQHGLFLSSDAYVLNGPDTDLAFILANKGFDVWLGNARGNTYSRSHKKFKPDNKYFWDFTFEDVGLFDLPASIDYVLKETGKQSMVFIGYSIGVAEAYIMLSERPEYNEKIELLVGIAPLGFFKPLYLNPYSVEQYQILSYNYQALKRQHYRTEIYPQSSFMQFYAFKECRFNCSIAFKSFFGEVTSKPNFASALKLFSHVPAGTSIKTILHLYQTMVTGQLFQFQPYNDDQIKVPFKAYNLTNVKTPVTIFKTKKESFLQEKDEDYMLQITPKIAIYELADSNLPIRELDFPLSARAKYINKSIFQILQLTFDSNRFPYDV